MNEATLLQKGFRRQPDGTWYKPRAAVRPLAAGQPEQAPVRPLEQSVQKRAPRPRSVGLVITLVTCRRRKTDDDNNVAALKPLRDAIAASLGLDDGDKRLRWEYGQCETHGSHGVIVKIEKRNL